jgi:hypothetical protein
MSSRE